MTLNVKPRYSAEGWSKPSFGARPNGKPPSPTVGYIYHPVIGIGGFTSVPPQLERQAKEQTPNTMKYCLSFLAALALASLSQFVAAQTRFLETTEQTQRAAEAIVASVAASNVNGALADFKQLSVIQGPGFDVFKAQIAGTQEKLLREFGSPTGYEYIRQDAVGSRVLRQQFLVFHENAPMVWNIVFFKQKNGWVITHLHFDGNSLKLFP